MHVSARGNESGAHGKAVPLCQIAVPGVTRWRWRADARHEASSLGLTGGKSKVVPIFRVIYSLHSFGLLSVISIADRRHLSKEQIT